MTRTSLEDAVQVVTRHGDFTGRESVVQFCIDEIEQKHRLGTVDSLEKERLIGILRAGRRSQSQEGGRLGES
jgi:hypothetical protein